MSDTCAACGAAPGAPDARWCGRCGARLDRRRSAGDRRPGARARPGGTLVDHALVGAPTRPAVVDDADEAHAAAEVAPGTDRWSPRARLAAALGVLLAVMVALLARPDAEVSYEARGFTARGDAARSGTVSLAPLAPPTEVAWTADVGAARPSSRVRSGGDVVLEQTAGGILAVREATTGEVRWLRRDGGQGTTALRVGGVVVVAGHDGARGGYAGLRGYDVDSGTERWRVDDVQLSGEPVPSGSHMLAIGRDRLTSADAETGTVRWQVHGAEQLDGSIRQVVPGGAGIAVWLTSPPGLVPSSPGVDNLVALLDRDTGDLRARWRFTPPFPEPAIAVGDRAVATGGRDGITITGTDGVVRHHVPDLIAVRLAAGGELLAVARVGGGVVGVDLRTGRVRWTRPDVVTDELVVADGLVIAGTGTIIDGQTGRTLSNQQRLQVATVAGETTILHLPAVAGDELEVRDRRGTTVVRAPLLTDEAAMPAVGAGRVFVPTTDGVEAYAVGDGRRDWSFDQLPTPAAFGGGQATTTTPAVADRTVLVTTGAGIRPGPSMVALELAGGVRAWDRADDVPAVRGPLTLAGDVAFVPVGSEIHAYDTVTGRRAFAAAVGTERGPLVVGPNRVIGGPALPLRNDAPGEVVAVLRRDRSVSWRTPLEPCSGPVLTGERVAWGTTDGVTALDERTGEPAWEFATERPVCLDPVAARGRIVVVEDPVMLHALPATQGGPPLWSVPLPSPAVASPVVAGEHVLVVLSDGTLAAYALEDGAHAWSFDLGGVPDASPAVLDGRILVHLRDGRLLALAP